MPPEGRIVTTVSVGASLVTYFLASTANRAGLADRQTGSFAVLVLT